MNCLYETKGKKNMPGKSEREEGWNIIKNIINCLKSYVRYRDGYFIIKGSVQQQIVTIPNQYVPSKITSKYINKTSRIQGEID